MSSWLIGILLLIVIAAVFFYSLIDKRLKAEGESRVRLFYWSLDLRTLRGRILFRLLTTYFKINKWKPL